MALKLFSQKNIWSSQYLFTSGANLFGSNHPKDKRNEFVGWIGRYFGERYLRIECLFGIGLVWGEKKGEKTYHAVHAYQYEVIPYTTVGIPLQLGFKFLPTKSISLGFDMHVNLNLDESFFSLLFSVECGMLRNEIDKRPLE